MSITSSKALVGALLAVALLLSVAFTPVAQAQTVEELNAQIQSLLSTIASLQAQISALGGGSVSGAACTFTRALTVGVSGADVTCLQDYLTTTGHFTFSGGSTGFFGPITQSAVAAWQAANGVAPAVGYFGPISQARYNTLNAGTAPTTPGTTPTTPTTGSGNEGSLTVTLEASPSDGTDVDKGETKNIAAIKLEADDSDITVERIDVNWGVRPWLYLSSVAILDGSTVVKEISGLSSSDFTEITEGSDYRLRLTGLNVVVPEGTKKVLTLRVSVLASTDKTAITIGVAFLANSVRGTDTAGFIHEEPSSALGSTGWPANTAAASSRTFDFADNTTGNVVATLNANSPEDRNVRVTNTGETENVELMRFDIEAEHQQVDVNAITFTVGTSAGDAPTLLKEVFLADNSGNKLASASTVGTTTTFSASDLEGLAAMITPAGSKTTYRLMGDIADADDFAAGSGASTTLTASTGITAEDGDFDTATVSSATIVGGDLFFYENVANFSALSASSSVVGDDSYLANVSMKFTITADGGDIFISKTPATALATSTTASSAGLRTVSASGGTSGDTTTAYKITSGSSRTFTFSGEMDNQNGASAGTKQLKITQVNWADDSTNLTEFGTTFGLEDLEANQTLTTS